MTAEAVLGLPSRTRETEFRVCQFTGLKVEAAAQRLIQANAVAAIVFLAIGGLMGLLVALTRWPAVHLLPAEYFYQALTAHGMNVLIFWIIFFEVALLYALCTIFLNCRIAAPKLGWVAFLLMIVGALMVDFSIYQGDSTVMFTSYPPMQASPYFYGGTILFAVGALIGVGIFFATLVIAKDERTYEGSWPLVTYGGVVAAVIAVFSIAGGAIILVPTFFWSIGWVDNIDPLMYRLVFWTLGHSTQQINVTAHITLWYMIPALLVGSKPLSEKVSRGAFLLYVFFLQLASVHHLLSDPAVSPSWKIVNTSYMMYLAVVGSMIHGMTVPGAIEAAQRRNGYDKGVFEWLRKAPWGHPAFAGMFMSLIFFGFIGGITGVVLGTEQLNMLMHNTIYVTGHFHGTVVAGTTLAFMAGAYVILPLVFQRDIVMPGLARIQIYLFGIGAAGISLFMMGAGTLGVPRRHWDITLSDATLHYDFSSGAFLMMGINGVFAIMAALGGLLFVLIAVGTVLFGTKIEPGYKLNFPMHAGGGAAVSQYGSHFSPKLYGTTVLVFIFFVSFALYYFVNWKYLTELWLLQ